MEILSDDATQSSRSLRRAKTQKRPVDTPEVFFKFYFTSYFQCYQYFYQYIL